MISQPLWQFAVHIASIVGFIGGAALLTYGIWGRR